METIMSSKNTSLSWEYITDCLIHEMENHVYEKDAKLPTENELAVRFQVPRTAIRKSYDRLKELGYIYSIQGQGSFFKGVKERISLNFLSNKSFTEKMTECGKSYSVQNIECVKLKKNHSLERLLCHSDSDSIYRISLLRIIDGEPAAIHTSYLSDFYFKDLSDCGSNITSIYRYLNSFGFYDLKTVDLEMSVIPLSKSERTLLNISGYESGLRLQEKCIHSKSGQILEVSSITYRCDRFVFQW
jgi:GntR family transcriptional regulator